MQQPAVTMKEREYRSLFESRPGFSLAKLAELEGIPAGTLAWWRSELRRRDVLRGSRPAGVPAVEAPTAFVPVHLVPPVGNHPDVRPVEAFRYEVVLTGGAVVRVVGDVEEQELSRVLRAVVESC